MKKLNIFLLVVSLLLIAYPKAEAKAPNDRGPLSKITFIHRRKGTVPVAPTPHSENAKPPWAEDKKPKPNNGSTCYTFLAKDARWKTSTDYYINPKNSGLVEDSVITIISSSAEKWDLASGYNVFNTAHRDDNASFDFNSWDSKNVVMFGTYDDPGVIAVTNVWGFFGGKPSSRELVEWDTLFNTYYQWGENDTPDVLIMDLENIATHELGHSAGLGDLYETSCLLETMYGYSDYGDIKKSTLESGDIAGIVKLYR